MKSRGGKNVGARCTTLMADGSICVGSGGGNSTE